MRTSEVVVAGAGPAGSIAALVLARAGVAVTLVDRATFPRHKLCGDTVNPGSLAILDRLGVGPSIRMRALPVGGMTVTGPGGAAVSADYPDDLQGAAIARRELDLLLLEAAVAAGVHFLPGIQVLGCMDNATTQRVSGVRVTAASRESRIPARVVIAADGRSSRLGRERDLIRFARPKRWAFGAYFSGIDGLTSRGEMHVRAKGYLGVARLGGNIANVCLVCEPRVLRDEDSKADAIMSIVGGDPALAVRFRRARRVSPLVTLGPLAVEARTAGCAGMLLAGDAAGFIDPMTGDGLRFALRGGELAAHAALAELATGAPAHEQLHAARMREFSSKWRLNRALRALADSPRGLDIVAALSARWSAPVRFLIAAAGDIPFAHRPCA
jgi:flavin-dependent dehydrogenase